MTFPPHPSAPRGDGVPGHSGRRVGKLYLAGVRRKEDRMNVLLALTNKTQPSTPSNRKIRYQYRSDEKSNIDASSATNTAMEGEKIIFEKLTPVAESPAESLPPVVASPALQKTSIVELPAMQQLLSGVIIWYSGLVWTRTMHEWPLAIHWRLGFLWKRVCIFKNIRCS